MKFTSKMFTIKSQNAGSRLKGQENLSIYYIYFNTPDGKSVRLGKHFCNKADAQKHISIVCKIANETRKGQ